MNYSAIVLVLFVLILVPGIIAQVMVRGAINKYSKIPARSGLTGAQAAAQILREAGIYDVAIEQTDGWLGDHYDPAKKVLALSADVYGRNSVAALGIAAHESGHAIQHQQAYVPLQVRTAVVPATMFVSQLMPLVVIGGFWLHFRPLIMLGIVVYAVVTLFQLITLPVEFNASARAKRILASGSLVASDEMVGVKRVLNAAALTYVAALIAAAAHLVWLILASRDRR